MAETKELKKKRMRRIIKILKKTYPDSTCSLFFNSPFQLLVATVLSAQCTDERVNQVTPKLFKTYPDPKAMSQAKLSEVERIIHSTGFYKNKAKAILSLSKDLVEKHQCQVPQKLEDLTALRGVGRKTANVVLGTAFQTPAMVVDTHVSRISRKLGFTKTKDPVKIEKDLIAVVPKKDWVQFTHLVIDHGRAICVARRPQCSSCPLESLCPKLP